MVQTLKIRVAVIGTGFIGGAIVNILRKIEDIEVVAIADKDKEALERVKPFLTKKVMVTTDPMEVFKKKLDVLVESTGSILDAALLVNHAIEQKVHVVLTNSEVDQAFGCLLAERAKDKGVIVTSDAGDQPGVLVRLINDICLMGFEVVMAGNNKGFLDRHANPESIKQEAIRRHLSYEICTSFTDGTKLALEMAIVANALDLDLLEIGMIGPKIDDLKRVLGVFNLERAYDLGGVVDYVLGAKPGGSVFAIGYSNDEDDRFYMNYYKMGKGPYYLFIRPYHLCHYETPLAIQSIMKYGKPIVIQKKRVLEVGCRAKINLQAGTKLEGVGGHHLYGILEKPGNLPIGIAEGTVLKRSKKRDEVIGFDDVEFTTTHDSLLDLWQEQKNLNLERKE